MACLPLTHIHPGCLADANAAPAPRQVVCYEIEVVTGSQPDAGTTASVYVEHRLMYREGSGRTAFCPGATDAFHLHSRNLGPLHKVGSGL